MSRRPWSRVLIGSIGLLTAGCGGVVSLLILGLAIPVQPSESGEGYDDQLVGLAGAVGAVIIAGAAVAMFRDQAVRWHIRSAAAIAGALAVGAVYLGWSSFSEVPSERERLLIVTGLLAALASLVTHLGLRISRSGDRAGEL